LHSDVPPPALVGAQVPASLQEDVNTWSSRVGVQPLRPGQLNALYSQDGSGAPAGGIGGVEDTMDVEAAHGIAPDADIVALGPNMDWSSLAEEYAYIEDHDLASIVSTSAALFETAGMRAVYDQIFQEGALQGIGFYFSSGDVGNLAWPASSSWATAVGGTSLAVGADGQRLWETGWGNSEAALSADKSTWGTPVPGGGAGGGRVDGQPQPWYQRGVVPATLASGPDGLRDRVGADVAMDADSATGMLVGGTALGNTSSGGAYTEARVGGTSLSSPLFAGVQALAQQAAGHRLGFASPEIYQRYGTPAFRDITKWTMPDGGYPVEAAATSFFAQHSLELVTHQGKEPVPAAPDTTPGFDEATGVGAPTGDYLRSFR